MRAEPRIRVSALLRWGDGVLLCRHEKKGKAVWLLPGGGVHSGETLMDALEREIREEVGIEPPRFEGPIALVDSIAPKGALVTKHVVHIIFAGDVDGSLESVASQDEAVRGHRLFALDELAGAVLHPPIQRFLQRWQPGDPAVYLGALWTPVKDLLGLTADYAAQFLGSLDDRAVGTNVSVEELRACLGGPLPLSGTEDGQVIADLIAAAEPGVTAIPGGRYFGFVIGGALPAALAADWLTSTWDQNAGLYVIGPSAAVVEEVALEWLRELLQLPEGVSAAFVTGCQMAHVTALAAARHHVLEREGWDLLNDGLQGAPRIRVLVGEHRHVTIDRALRYLGIGARQIEPLAADEEGRLRPEALRAALADSAGPTIVCAQAGDVNSGCFDPLDEIADAVDGSGAWLHVDGAFGLWASASPRLRHLTAGAERADSWTTDGHKWLNVPYDSGIAFCAHPAAHRAAMSVSASYLEQSDPDAARDQLDWTPEFSRRARGFPIYAAIRALGREGIAAMVERCCDHAARFAELLGAEPGVEILNEVVLNQVLVRFGDDDALTQATVKAVQEDGTCWLSGTVWQGKAAMRVSVSSWRTSDEDVERSAGAILEAAAAVSGSLRAS